MPAPLLASALVALAPLASFFTDATARLGSPQPCGPGDTEGCYSSYVALADLDGDGDLDAVFASGGGYYAPGDAAPMALYLNDGHGTFAESNATAVGGFTGRLRQVAIGDIDGDGDNDVIAPDSWAMQDDAVFVNDGQRPPSFANEGVARLGTKSRAGAVRLGDLDDDGDLDLVITDWGDAPPGSKGTAKVYLNDGHSSFSELAAAVPQDTDSQGTGPIDADLFDADGDLDLDLILASRQGESLLFVNDGTGHFADAGAQLADQPGPYVYGPDECDVDGDGDLDVWLDNGADDLLEQLEINDGHGRFADETAARVTGNVAAADDNEVQCADLDGDGDLDAIVASLSDQERMLANDGTGHFALRADAFPALSDATLGLDLGDVDGDGRLDAIAAVGEAPPFLNHLYLGTSEQPADTRAPKIRAWKLQAEQNGTRVVRFAISDAATSDVGPRLREAHVQLVEAGMRVDARFVGGDLFRAVLPVAAASAQAQHFQLCATDAAGNAACGEPQELTPGTEPPPPPDDDGCGCHVGGRTDAPGAPLVLTVALIALATFVRRRRRSTRTL
jgi:MYXO-CTERM domain-containing protein